MEVCMKIVKLIAIILLLIISPGGVFAGEKTPDVIQLNSGPISGKIEDGVRTFLGIPYASPPVGELRWKPPQAVTP
jgi:para-nitrobenzyl esterase